MYWSPTDARKRPDVIVCFIIVPFNNMWFSVTYISNEDSSHLGLQFSVLYLHGCVEDFLENTLDNYNNKLVVCTKNEFSGVFKPKWTFTTDDVLGMLEDASLLKGLCLLDMKVMEGSSQTVSFKTPSLFILKHEYCQRLFNLNNLKNNQTKEVGAWWKGKKQSACSANLHNEQ